MLRQLRHFQLQSNHIEGILNVRKGEDKALQIFIETPILSVEALEDYVAVCQPDAQLRRQIGLNVRVGDHIAPLGGHDVEEKLLTIIVSSRNKTAWQLHCDYEDLHPFTDCNGRSGRALWLWKMLRGSEQDKRMALDLGFLHTFYYQTLAERRK